MYSVYYNYSMQDSAFLKSLSEPAPVDDVLLRVKLSVDNAIMRYLGELKGMDTDDIPEITMTRSTYPIIADRLVKDTNLVS